MSTVLDSGSADPLLALIEQFIYLQSLFGNALNEPLPKFALSVKDDPIIAVQKAARQIAKHLGLDDLTFVVLIREQETEVAGRIHIDGSPDIVEVELSPTLMRFPNAVFATLCHEVMHKYLHRHGVRLEDTLSNERLTDAACVYFGLGVFMIEGCESERSFYVTGGRKTSSLRTGYLTPNEFALAYCLFENMAALRRKSRTTVSQIAAQRIKLARQALREKGLTMESLGDVHGEMLMRVERSIRKRQHDDLRTRSLLNAFSSEEVMKNVWIECISLHRKLQQYQIHQNQLSAEADVARVYLNAWRILVELSYLRTYSRSGLRSIREYRRKRADNPVSQIACPSCEQWLRVLVDHAVLNVRCPRCRYRFPIAAHYPALLRRIARSVRNILARKTFKGRAT